MNSFLSEEELKMIGLKQYGENVFLSRKASLYGVENISIGSNVRIDDFCILSGNIEIGSYVHIAAYSALYAGSVGIQLSDFTTISSRVCIYAISDDYEGNGLTFPYVPDRLRKVQSAKIMISKHSIIGSGTTVLPGAYISEGTAIGSMSLCKSKTMPWTIYAGIPVSVIKPRSKQLIELEQEFLKNEL